MAHDAHVGRTIDSCSRAMSVALVTLLLTTRGLHELDDVRKLGKREPVKYLPVSVYKVVNDRIKIALIKCSRVESMRLV